VLDLSALVNLSHGESQYAREVVRQSIVYGVALLVPAAAAQYLGSYHRDKGARLLDLSVLLLAPLDQGTVTAAISHADVLERNVQRNPGVDTGEERTVAALVAAHAIQLSKTRGWRILTATPHLYEDIDIRIEILP
jgi:hypothetical protein